MNTGTDRKHAEMLSLAKQAARDIEEQDYRRAMWRLADALGLCGERVTSDTLGQPGQFTGRGYALAKAVEAELALESQSY